MMADKKTVEQELEELKAYFKKPEVIEKVTAVAIQFKEVFGFEWFTFNQCATVFRKDSSLEQMVDIIRSLQMTGFLVANNKKSVERFRLGKQHFNTLKDEFTRQHKS